MVHFLQDTEQLSKVLKKALQGGNLKIGFLGGSITQGCSPIFSENAYVERVIKWFKEKFPNTIIEGINAGVGATGSLIGVHRVERDLIRYNPDIVFVEFAANDVTPKKDTNLSYESLIRKLVTKLPEAAIVEIFMTLESGESAEDEETRIAEHYSIPYVSYRQEIFKNIEVGTYRWEDIETDEVHPNDRGHGIVADLIITLMEDALEQDVESCYKRKIPESTIFGAPYLEGNLIEFRDLNIIEEIGWSETEEAFRTINTGYASLVGEDKVSLTCTVEGKNVFLLYVKGIEEERAQVDITVNGEKIERLDTFFEEGWGNYPETYSLFSSDVRQEVTIKIEMLGAEKGKILNLLGFLVS